MQSQNQKLLQDWKSEFTSTMFREYELQIATFEMSCRLDSEEIKEEKKYFPGNTLRVPTLMNMIQGKTLRVPTPCSISRLMTIRI